MNQKFENKSENIIFCLLKNLERLFILPNKINLTSILMKEFENNNLSNCNRNLLIFNKKNSYFLINKSYYLRALNSIDEKTLIEVKYFKYNINSFLIEPLSFLSVLLQRKSEVYRIFGFFRFR